MLKLVPMLLSLYFLSQQLLHLIKNIKKNGKCDSYLTHIWRYHCSGDSPVKILNIRSFQLTLRLSSAVDIDYVD
jgi:hypothetical protein